MKMTRDEAKRHIDQGLERLNAALAEGRSEEFERYLSTMGRFHHYSFNNILLILMQNAEASHVAGFRAWQGLGRQVKKGESGIAIVAPCRYKTKVENDDGEEQTAYALRGFTVAYVYDIEQTEGDELPQFTAVSGDPGEALARLKAYIEELGVELNYHPSLGPGRLGCSAGGTISVLEGLDAALEFSVLIHEMAHEDLHHGERRAETTKTIRETEAEAVATVVCSAFGVDSTERSSDYISLYRGTTETLGESLKFIQKTAQQIIEGINALDLEHNKQVEHVEQPATVSDCNHTTQCFDDSGELQGSWRTEDVDGGTRVDCKRCGKFYGYLLDDTTSEETPTLVGASSTATQAVEQSEQPLRTGRADYDERQAERIERYHELADKRSTEATATHDEARRMAGAIPFGQPILVGHHSERRDRNYRERIHSKFGKAFELGDNAKYWERRAEAAESGSAISSDDPTAIEKLTAKLEALEQSQRFMKAINSAWRAVGKPAPDNVEGWARIANHPDVELEPEQLERLRKAYADLEKWQRTSAPFPSYSLSNNNAEIRRVKERIKQLEESANAEHVDQDRGVCRYVEDPELNRVQLFFDGKPPADTRTILKQNGFRFSKRDGNAWQRLLNANGKHAAEYVISQLQQEAEKCPT